MAKLTANQYRRFFAKVELTPKCWLWTGATTSEGYGHLSFRGHLEKAHRAAWIIFYSDIPKDTSVHGICVLHECDNPKCVNPEHLFLGTNIENVRDRDKKGRNVNYLGEKHGRAKLTEEKVREIRRLSETQSSNQIAKKYGVSPGTISSIVRRVNWRHVE